MNVSLPFSDGQEKTDPQSDLALMLAGEWRRDPKLKGKSDGITLARDGSYTDPSEFEKIRPLQNSPNTKVRLSLQWRITNTYLVELQNTKQVDYNFDTYGGTSISETIHSYTWDGNSRLTFKSLRVIQRGINEWAVDKDGMRTNKQPWTKEIKDGDFWGGVRLTVPDHTLVKVVPPMAVPRTVFGELIGSISRPDPNASEVFNKRVSDIIRKAWETNPEATDHELQIYMERLRKNTGDKDPALVAAEHYFFGRWLQPYISALRPAGPIMENENMLLCWAWELTQASPYGLFLRPGPRDDNVFDYTNEIVDWGTLGLTNPSIFGKDRWKWR